VTSLAAVPALRDLSPAALAAVAADARPARFAAGTVLRPAGTAAETVVLLLSGTAVATWTTAGGQEVWPARWTGPAIADKPAVLGGGVPETGLAAVTPVSVRLLSRRRFRRLLATEPTVRDHVLRHLAGDVADTRARLARAVALTATARVAAHLAAQPPAGGPAWRGSQEDLGRLLGLSRVTVNRALRRLAAAGAVATLPHGVTVTDRAALERAAAADHPPAAG
jgi:CRP-like cAMP-binding protein